jgi:hypothetical protein
MRQTLVLSIGKAGARERVRPLSPSSRERNQVGLKTLFFVALQNAHVAEQEIAFAR